MKIKILRNTVAGRRPVEVGEILDVSEQEARYLIARKLAEEVSQSKPAPETVETADLKPAELETTAKRAKRKE